MTTLRGQFGLIIAVSILAVTGCGGGDGPLHPTPSSAEIVDASGARWTVNGGVIYVDGHAAAYSDGVVLLLYQNNVVYQQNQAGGWWYWKDGDWTATTDPRGSVALPTPSPSGSTIPGLSKLIDSVGSQWTITGGVVYRDDVPAGVSAAVIELLYHSSAIYQQNASGNWWSWDGAQWTPTTNPRVAATSPASNAAVSSHGSTIFTVGQLVDSAHNVWTISDGVIFRNSAPAGNSGYVAELRYHDDVVYQRNEAGNWWKWDEGWLPATDPSIISVPVDGACGTASLVPVTAAPTLGLCSAGTATTISGSGPWSWNCSGEVGGATKSCSVSVARPLPGEALAAETNRPNNSTFIRGEAVRVTFIATKLAPFSSTSMNVRISDEMDATIASQAISMTADADGTAQSTLTPPSSEYGYYKISATLASGTSLKALGTRPAGFITYAVVQDPALRVDYGDAESRFGLQGGFNERQGSVIPYLGIRHVISSAQGWYTLEPLRAGQFAADRAAALASGRLYPAKSQVTDAVTYNGSPWNTYPLTTVTRSSLPKWAIEPSTAGTQCKDFGALNAAGIAGLPGFARELALQVAADYPNQTMHYYQLTWEPDYNWCYGGTPAQLVQMYKLAYAAIHAADPKAVVAGPTLFPVSTDALNDLWAAGLSSHVDALATHPYVAWPPETNNLIRNTRAQMQAANAAKGRSLPFIGTEHGLLSAEVGELNQALGNIRSTLILLGEGFKFAIGFYIADFWGTSPANAETFGFYWNLNPGINFGTDKLGPKPTVPAYAAMTFLLDGSTSGGPVTGLQGTQLGYRFQRNGAVTLVLWDYQESSSSVSIPASGQSAQICDYMGRCKTSATINGRIALSLGPAPIYVSALGL